MKRIIIDTNLWISFLITKDYSKLDEILFEKKAILIFSQELLDEFLEVAKRPKFRRFFPTGDIETLLETIEEYAIFVEVKVLWIFVETPKITFYWHSPKMGKPTFYFQATTTY